MADDLPPKDDWSKRRIALSVLGAFCMGIISYVVVRDSDTIVAQTAVTWGFTGLCAAAGYYVTGSVWEFVGRIKK